MNLRVGRLSIFIICSLAPAAACLDLTPTWVPPPDQAGSLEAQQRCHECLYSASDPGPGCGDEMAICNQNFACQSGLACSFERGCYGRDRSHAIACGGPCQAVVRRVDDPVVPLLLRVYQCVTDGPCAPACIPEQIGVGGAADASMSEGNTSEGGACVNVADQAIVNAGLNTAAEACGRRCFSSQTPECHRDCIASQTGLSLACSACWGETIHCTASRCLPQCLAPDGAECTNCSEENCTPAFRSCSGLP